MAPLGSEYCSTVFYHSNQPPLDERLTVLLPLDAACLRESHLYFEVSHCSSTFIGGNNETSCFAQGYLPLCSEAGGLLLDSAHTVTFYELGKSGERDSDLLRDLSRNNWTTTDRAKRTTETLQVSTQLRSTLVSQDSDVQSLLFWRGLRLHADPTHQALKQVQLYCMYCSATKTQTHSILCSLTHKLTHSRDLCSFCSL
jgi:hypothetical protein